MYQDVVLADNPLAYYRLGESSGTQAADSSGNARHGTYTGGYTLGQPGGIVGDADQSVLIDGSTGYVEFANLLSTGLHGVAACTLEAWVNNDVAPSGERVMLVVNQHSASYGPAMRFTGTNVFDVGGRSVSTDSFQSTGNLPFTGSGAWRHVVGILRFTTKRILVYLDSVKVADVAVTFANNTYTHGTPTSQDRIGSSPTTSAVWDGFIDEVAVYPGELSLARIREHYAVGKKLFSHRPVRNPKTGLYSIHHLGI